MRYCSIYQLSQLLCLSVFSAYAEETNVIYMPQDVGGVYEDKDRAEMNAKAKEEAMRLGECRPADLDPTGNWGAVIYGLQLSIRAQTNVFVAGEPIPVSVIVRNTTTNDLSIYDWSRGTETLFGVVLESGRVVPPHILGTSGYGFRPLAAKHQIKFNYDLTRYDSFQPGTYRVFGEQTVVDFLRTTNRMSTRTNLDSGMITIKVVPK